MGELRTVRFGIWGSGAVAHDVAADFRFVDNARLQAVASRTLENAQRFAERHRVPKSGAGLASLLDDPDVDVIYIATPHTRHAEDCLACIDAGKAVLCEKPFTVNAAQAERVAAAARSRKVFCMEAMWTRFIPAVAAARALVHSGALGPVRLVQGNFAYPAAYDPAGRLFDRALAGGALLDRGVYLISLTQHLLGEPLSMHGSSVLGASGVDEHSVYQLTHGHGALADLAASLRVQGSNEFLIFGEQGSLKLSEPFYRAHHFEWRTTPAPQASLGPPTAAGRLKAALARSAGLSALRHWLQRVKGLVSTRGTSLAFPGHGYQFELAEVARCLRQGLLESPTMPLADSINVMRTMDTLRRQWGLVYPHE